MQEEYQQEMREIDASAKTNKEAAVAKIREETQRNVEIEKLNFKKDLENFKRIWD